MHKQKITLTPDIYFENVCPTLNMNIRSELYATNEFTFAVAVILSAQATDKKVNEVTPTLFQIAPNPDKMLELGLDKLKNHFANLKKDIIDKKDIRVFSNVGKHFYNEFISPKLFADVE